LKRCSRFLARRQADRQAVNSLTLGEAYALASRLEEAYALAERALTHAREHHRPNNLGNAVGPLALALSQRERERRLLCLQHLLEHCIGFCHVPVHEEGER
jgi:hypothetical protein